MPANGPTWTFDVRTPLNLRPSDHWTNKINQPYNLSATTQHVLNTIDHPRAATDYLALPIRRDLSFIAAKAARMTANPLFHDDQKRAASRVAIAGQITGTELTGNQSCNNCKEDPKGPFNECIVHPGKHNGACMDCHYSNHAPECSLY